MAHALLEAPTGAPHPLDVVERIAVANGWCFERDDDDELAIQVRRPGCAYHLWFSWRHGCERLLFSCAFELRVPAPRREALYVLLAHVNERLGLGHFDFYADDGLVMFRAALPLRGGPGVSIEQAHDLIDIALEECERYYPTFQFVVWGGKSPAEAIAASLLDTVAEA